MTLAAGIGDGEQLIAPAAADGLRVQPLRQFGQRRVGCAEQQPATQIATQRQASGVHALCEVRVDRPAFDRTEQQRLARR